VHKTKRLLVLDTGQATGSISAEIVARVCMKCHDILLKAPLRIALPDFPTPTSFSLTKYFYRGAEDIIFEVMKMLDKNVKKEVLKIKKTFPHDVPGDWFKGPF
jgi:pyruvate dehydrogenase E1 component beta subunit